MKEETPQPATAETRRLAAIMFTDMVGFSRQMGADEARMLRLLAVHNQVIQRAVTEQYKHAIAPLKKAIAFSSNYLPAHVNLAICYAELGWEEEAQAEAAEILRLSPNFSVEMLRRMIPAEDPAIVERYLTALRKAGLK
jgi:Flp pilus assembly protein TadD